MKTYLKNNYLFLILIGLLVILIVFSTRKNNKDLKDLKKENKVLAKQMDSLNYRYSIDSLTRESVLIEQEKIRKEYNEVLDDINLFNRSLSKFKTLYEKIPNYNDISSDSLVQLFNRRFDY